MNGSILITRVSRHQPQLNTSEHWKKSLSTSMPQLGDTSNMRHANLIAPFKGAQLYGNANSTAKWVEDEKSGVLRRRE
jgi:hypothetical protein